jgi:hypothetical protein
MQLWLRRLIFISIVVGLCLAGPAVPTTAQTKMEKLHVGYKKNNLDINPLSGEEVAKTVDNIFKIEPTIAAKLRQILLPK